MSLFHRKTKNKASNVDFKRPKQNLGQKKRSVTETPLQFKTKSKLY
jgi:hypothetical protein